ncbi:sphingomyelin phosphodiesterase 2 [Sceloporus undulatus]|uniref:sphingomyelin phosphodiesterase 2 n=1 Tax=Sceloporus undulatus TaxID=8520 RepID=UPI001C4DD53F|nr:sphingomyelin phosphodiesterase 2 [Sceloporus undulatus]XP_042320129.1 sphingomyelin phosphodiesterase 2 [Sceloporus undulatus]XP_042320130.1 sphingomyelin phosphodiesterase 2 [Sceloporus undulatus]
MEKASPLQLRIFDLNCWAIRYLSKLRQERIELIGDVLNQEGFDLALLQEVWSEKDYWELKKKLCTRYPSSHYFKSGVIGSGLCVFSRHQILDTFLYQYSVNGYPYMFQHGDWFGGKSVGLVVLKIQGIVFNVYVTHLHAEYCREKDAYLPHRVVQAWELGQFIQHTSKGADVVLLGGDLNMHPEDVGVRLLRGWVGLQDSFIAAEKVSGCEDGSTLVPANCFTSKKELHCYPQGIRIDYILYKGLSQYEVKCNSHETTTGTAPNKDIPYSDHEAVMASLSVAKTQSDVLNHPTVEPALVDILNEARMEVRVGLHSAERQQYSCGRMAVLAVLLLFMQGAMGLTSIFGGTLQQPFPKFSFSLLSLLAVLVLLISTVLYLFHTIEVKMLQGTEEQMRLRLQTLQDKLSSG